MSDISESVRLKLMNREIDKVNAFIGVVDKRFDLGQYGRIYDMCCGNGFLGVHFNKPVYGVDNARNRRRQEIVAQSPGYEFEQRDIWDHMVLEPGSLVLAIHACGNLTDRVIELALNSSNDFAVMTCCHGDRQYFSPKDRPDHWLALQLGRDHYADLLRAAYVSEQGYDSGIEFIDEAITPKNRIVWGSKARNSP